ncbi:MAG TPA: hypothetical protein VK469_01675 [Candidatus Kapabacteria bacterium]|nr:hypothetical protein [Candidatus Kapabacteria bacterium]
MYGKIIRSGAVAEEFVFRIDERSLLKKSLLSYTIQLSKNILAGG